MNSTKNKILRILEGIFLIPLTFGCILYTMYDLIGVSRGDSVLRSLHIPFTLNQITIISIVSLACEVILWALRWNLVKHPKQKYEGKVKSSKKNGEESSKNQ